MWCEASLLNADRVRYRNIWVRSGGLAQCRHCGANKGGRGSLRGYHGRRIAGDLNGSTQASIDDVWRGVVEKYEVLDDSGCGGSH